MIKNRTGVELEHPFLSDLHKYLVLESDFDAAEHVLEEAHGCNIFNEYINNAEYKPTWKRIWSTTEGKERDIYSANKRMLTRILR